MREQQYTVGLHALFSNRTLTFSFSRRLWTRFPRLAPGRKRGRYFDPMSPFSRYQVCWEKCALVASVTRGLVFLVLRHYGMHLVFNRKLLLLERNLFQLFLITWIG